MNSKKRQNLMKWKFSFKNKFFDLALIIRSILYGWFLTYKKLSDNFQGTSEN